MEKISKFTPQEFYRYLCLWSDLLAAEGDYQSALFCLNFLKTAIPDAPGLWGRRIRYNLRRLFGK